MRSEVTDLNSTAGMVTSIVNNVSLGSRSFIGNAQNIGISRRPHSGNKVYAATDIPLDLTATTPVTLIDNLIQGPSSVPQVLMGIAVRMSFIRRQYVREHRFLASSRYPAAVLITDKARPPLLITQSKSPPMEMRRPTRYLG